MAVRIRRNGKIVCAALNEAGHGDQYIDDQTHYELSVVKKLLVTTHNDVHMSTGGEWWWKDQVPATVIIDPFYLNQ